VDSSSAFTPSVLERWRRRENLLPGLVLIALAAAGWAYVAYQAASMGSMRSAMGGIGGIATFLSAWAVMMVAMMVPATLPLILLYRTIARNRLSLVQARVGMVSLLAGYIAIWTAAGLPVYAYALYAEGAGSLATVLPALLLVAGGIYQFTPLKRICHARCSSPLFFLMQNWQSGARGAVRLGMLHGVDCLGCCAGLMVGLVALGMMNLAWMLTAAVIIFAEKTIPNSHRIARPLGVVMVAGGVVLPATSLLGAMVHGMECMLRARSSIHSTSEKKGVLGRSDPKTPPIRADAPLSKKFGDAPRCAACPSPIQVWRSRWRTGLRLGTKRGTSSQYRWYGTPKRSPSSRSSKGSWKASWTR
jgi:predicted metal-binding membrane protein